MTPASSIPAATPPNGLPHWMLAEIHEQPEALRRTLDHYVLGNAFRPENTAPISAWLRSHQQLLIAASGSSRHAALAGEILLEDVTTLPVDVEYASEYSFRTPQTTPGAGVVVISQSGETADTLLALRRALAAGLPTLAVTNVPGSTMMREAQVAMPLLAGPEHAIPATKSFTAQLLAMILLSLLAAETQSTLPPAEIARRLAALHDLPARIARQLPAWSSAAQTFAQNLPAASSFLFCGRGLHFPIAREGALKLKETAYVQAEAYPAGELRHGPTALISPATPLVILATVDPADPGSVRRYETVLHLTRELRTLRAPILALANAGDTAMRDLATTFIPVEPATEPIAALCEAIPLQLLAYHHATARGLDVDHPRHLVKSVQAL